MPPKVVFVGRPFPCGGAPSTWKTMPVGDFAAGRTRAMSPVVVVLGDRALEEISPRVVDDATRATRTEPIVAPTRAPAELIALWSRSYVGEVVSEPRLPDRVREIALRHLRPRMAPAEWLHAPPRSPDAERLARALTLLDAPRVEAWARVVSLSPDQLSRRCLAAFGMRPRRVVIAYVLAQIRIGQRDGVTLAAIADSLGYADAPSLLRVLRSAMRGGPRAPALPRL